MEAIFKSICKNGKLVDLNPDEERMYALEHEGQEIIKQYKLAARVSEKMRMYSYYHAVVLHCAMMGFTYAGEPGMDKVKADYLLRAEFAKDFIQRKDGTYTPIMIDKSKMSKARLLKFLQDCIFFIETELKFKVPEGSEYRVSKRTGHNFKKVSTRKEES
jgi:hypothetical protein